MFFSPLNPLGHDDEKSFHKDVTIPKKFHYCSKWRNGQDAVQCVTLEEAQKLGLQFWQTKSNALCIQSRLAPLFAPRVTLEVAGKCGSSGSKRETASDNQRGIVMQENL